MLPINFNDIKLSAIVINFTLVYSNKQSLDLYGFAYLFWLIV